MTYQQFCAWRLVTALAVRRIDRVHVSGEMIQARTDRSSPATTIALC
jgi:hypothetical protein